MLVCKCGATFCGIFGIEEGAKFGPTFEGQNLKNFWGILLGPTWGTKNTTTKRIFIFSQMMFWVQQEIGVILNTVSHHFQENCNTV